MTERKPPGLSYESWIDKQIRTAQERGDFDNLAGAGRPIPGAGRPDDGLWWVNQLVARENINGLPPALRLRREVDDLLDRVSTERSEDDVRTVVAGLNARIVEALRKPGDGPPVAVVPVDVERVLRSWRETRPGA